MSCLAVATSCLLLSLVILSPISEAAPRLSENDLPDSGEYAWKMPIYFGLMGANNNDESDRRDERVAALLPPRTGMLRTYGAVTSDSDVADLLRAAVEAEEQAAMFRILAVNVQKVEEEPEEEEPSRRSQRRLPLGFRMGANPWQIQKMKTWMKLRQKARKGAAASGQN